MDTYLQPQDDGLSVREAGPWARIKLDYLKRYTDVFETSMRKKWSVRCYVDLLAGPGKNRDRDSGKIFLGSPLIALTTKYPFTDYFFVDENDENTKALQKRCAASPHSHRTQICAGDCNDLVDDIVAQLRQDDRRSLNLAFLDPEGMELRWDTVASLAAVQRMDLIIIYPESALNRSMPWAFETEGQTSIDDFFGDRGWRKIRQDWLSQGKTSIPHRQLIDFYRAKLQGLGYQEVLQGDQIEPLIGMCQAF